MIRNLGKVLVPALAAAIIGSTGRVTSAELIETKLTASDALQYEYFGCSVGIDGDTVIVGKHGDDLAGHWTGSAYIFQRQGTHWVQQAKLIASDAAADDNFGLRVGISGDTAIVGAYGNDDAGHHSGSAYIFQRSGSSWTEQAKLTASDAAADYEFGSSVAVSGDTAIIGAYRTPGDDDTGSAYIFQRDGADWTEQAKLTASDAAFGDRFGARVGICGDTVIVGASGNDDHGYNTGSAYVFHREGSSWTEQAKFTAPGANMFGISVGIDGDTAIVGKYRGSSAYISAYIFTRDGSSWAQQAELTAPDVESDDNFGYYLDISGDIAIIGASRDDDHGSSSGSAYLFSRNGSSWTQRAKLTASDAAADDRFGNCVAISGDTAIAGADMHDDHGPSSGAAYIYGPIPEPSCLVLAIAGLPGLLAYAWRRRKQCRAIGTHPGSLLNSWAGGRGQTPNLQFGRRSRNA